MASLESFFLKKVDFYQKLDIEFLPCVPYLASSISLLLFILNLEMVNNFTDNLPQTSQA